MWLNVECVVNNLGMGWGSDSGEIGEEMEGGGAKSGCCEERGREMSL